MSDQTGQGIGQQLDQMGQQKIKQTNREQMSDQRVKKRPKQDQTMCTWSTSETLQHIETGLCILAGFRHYH